MEHETEQLTDHLGRLVAFGGAGSVILCVYHRDGVMRVPLAPRTTWIIGREPPSDIQIKDGSLSRQHARIVTGPSAEMTIQDLDSTNGTAINGVRVESGEVRLGDQVTLGAVTLALQLLGGPEGEPIALESHDRFGVRVAEEVARARTFRRQFALLMIRASQAGVARHVSSWVTRITGLRPVDHVGLYAPDCVEILLPEADPATAAERAGQIARALAGAAPAVVVGAYPRDATSAGALIDGCREALCACEGGVQMVSDLAGRASRQTAVAEPVLGPQMQRVCNEADRVAESEITVLILGETGVGKEVLARRIHARSRRSGGRFFAVNCGAIPPHLVESTLFGHEKGAFTGAGERREGLFESSQGGTILLDEVGELPLEAQAALLRALDTRRITRVGSTREIAIDVRVLAATHRDLERMVREQAFRQDLLYRLNSVALKIPPLRERRAEIGPLVTRFIAGAAQANRREPPQIDPEALSLLESYGWPGNVRELRNAIERAVVICQDGLITGDDLPERVRLGLLESRALSADGVASNDLDFKVLVQQYECRLILDALRACDWNQSEAARRLRIPRRTLVHKMKAYGLRKLGYALSAPGGAGE